MAFGRHATTRKQKQANQKLDTQIDVQRAILECLELIEERLEYIEQARSRPHQAERHSDPHDYVGEP